MSAYRRMDVSAYGRIGVSAFASWERVGGALLATPALPHNRDDFFPRNNRPAFATVDKSAVYSLLHGITYRTF